MARGKNRWLVGLLSVTVLLALAGVALAWLLTPLGPDPEAVDALRSTEEVDFREMEYGYVFTPVDDDPTVGMVLYPGGRVDYRSYSLLARDLAERGYLVAVVQMPLNLALLDSNRADAVIEAHPEIVLWTVGGHSLGGAMAAKYAYENDGAVQALALMAAYPPSGIDLSETAISATSIYATLDGVADAERFRSSGSMLPTSTVYVPITGGNHAQFGAYGPQPGDNEPLISAEDQRWFTVNAIQEMLMPLRRRSGSLGVYGRPAA